MPLYCLTFLTYTIHKQLNMKFELEASSFARTTVKKSFIRKFYRRVSQSIWKFWFPKVIIQIMIIFIILKAWMSVRMSNITSIIVFITRIYLYVSNSYKLFAYKIVSASIISSTSIIEVIEFKRAIFLVKLLS